MGGLTEPQKQSNNFPAFLSLLTWNPALVRLVPGVSPDVLLQVGELGELALADLATVRLDPQVDSRVLRQIGAVGECFSTSCTLVRLRLPKMDLRVQLQVGLAVESLENEELGENVSQWKNRVEKMMRWKKRGRNCGGFATNDDGGGRVGLADVSCTPCPTSFTMTASQ